MIAVIRLSRQLYSDPVTDYMTGSVDHRIEGSSAGVQTNYQVLFRVYRGYGSNTGNTLYIPPSELRSDYADIRFVDDKLRTLPHYIEIVGSNYADTLVNLLEIPTTGTTIRVLFGGGAIISGSNGAAAFPIFFDGFDSFSSTIWPTSTNASASGGILTISNGSILGATQYPVNRKFRTYASLANNVNCNIGQSESTNYTLFQGNYPTGSAINARSSSGSETSANLGASAGYHVYEYVRKSTTAVLFYIDNVLKSTISTNVPTSAIKISCSASSGATVSMDYVSILNYCDPEPSHGWWGSLEDL